MKLIPIYRMGWHDAAKIIKEGGRIVKFSDGHAEVIGPRKITQRWQGIYGHIQDVEPECCEGYLTAQSVELLEKHTTRDE